ncbi:MAG: ATP-binding protein [Oligoflexales bacterium]
MDDVQFENPKIFLENAKVCIHFVGCDGTILWANKTELETFGYEKSEYIGQNISKFHVDQCTIDDIINRLVKKEVLNKYSARILRKDGSIAEVIINSDAFFVGKKLVHTRCFTVDVSAEKIFERKLEEQNRAFKALILDLEDESKRRKVAEQRALKAKNQAKQANEAKSQFLANISHEIRTPLSAISGFVELLVGNQTKEAPYDKFLDAINRNTKHLKALVEEILDFSKIEANIITAKHIETDLQNELYDIYSICYKKAEAKKIKFSFSFVTSVPKLVHTDPTKLRQVLINLIDNAIKFTKKGSVTVKISYFLSSYNMSKIKFLVADTGPGIPINQGSYVFESFGQVKDTISHKESGVGLGLYISKKLVKILGGDLELLDQGQHKGKKGCTFKISIPIDHPSDVAMFNTIYPSNIDPEKISKIQSSSGIKILVVEDNLDIQNFISIILASLGAEVHVS